MFSLASVMAASRSDTVFSNAFFLSSARSNCTSQYSFLLLSSCCSFFNSATKSSIMPMTFSKPIFLPRRAREMKSSSGRRLLLRWHSWIKARASAFMDVLIEELLLGSAVLVEILQELFVIDETLTGVAGIILHLLDLDTEVANTDELVLDHASESLDLLFLGCNELLVHGLQDACDLSTCWSVVRGAGQEREDVVAVGIVHVVLAHHKALQGGCCLSLQESTAGTLLNGCGGLGKGSEVGLEVGLGRLKGRVLLLAQSGSCSHCRFGCGTIVLVRLQVILQLRKLADALLNGRCKLWALCLCISNALGEGAASVLDFCLQILQHGHYLPDGVCLRCQGNGGDDGETQQRTHHDWLQWGCAVTRS